MGVYKRGSVGEIVATIVIVGIVVVLTIGVLIPLAKTNWDQGRKTNERQNDIGIEIDSMASPQ